LDHYHNNLGSSAYIYITCSTSIVDILETENTARARTLHLPSPTTSEVKPYRLCMSTVDNFK